MKKIKEMLFKARRMLGLVHGHREAGMATAEYAVGTVATISLGALFIGILKSPEFREGIWNLIVWIISLISGIQI